MTEFEKNFNNFKKTKMTEGYHLTLHEREGAVVKALESLGGESSIGKILDAIFGNLRSEITGIQRNAVRGVLITLCRRGRAEETVKETETIVFKKRITYKTKAQEHKATNLEDTIITKGEPK